MKTSILNLLGSTKYWWIVLVLGIAMVLCGFAYWFWPAIGYAVSSQLFGWLMILAGVVQICVSSAKNRPSGWGWWLTGGILDMFIGFMLVRSIVLSELVFPYFIAIVFMYWGISVIFNSVSQRVHKYWWIYLLNGILLLIISFLFIESGYLQDMMMTSFLTSIAFIYWGLSIMIMSYDMRPTDR